MNLCPPLWPPLGCCCCSAGGDLQPFHCRRSDCAPCWQSLLFDCLRCCRRYRPAIRGRSRRSRPPHWPLPQWHHRPHRYFHRGRRQSHQRQHPSHHHPRPLRTEIRRRSARPPFPLTLAAPAPARYGGPQQQAQDGRQQNLSRTSPARQRCREEEGRGLAAGHCQLPQILLLLPKRVRLRRVCRIGHHCRRSCQRR